MKDLKSFLTIDSTFFSKEIEATHPLNQILEKGLSQYTVSQNDFNTPDILWGKERYQLEKSSLFMGLDEEKQNKILAKMTQLNLSLSCYIEKSGHNYGAKMILLSDSIQEKSLYSMFVAEEAIHLKEFSHFVQFKIDPQIHWHPMLNPLAKVIQQGEKNTCLYVIQVLLEGFGMSHYNSLKNDCEYRPLVNVFNRILKDEARHHGAGLIMAKESQLKKIEREEIFEYTREFVKALQSANWVIEVIEEFSSPISKQEKKKHYEETQYQSTIEKRLLMLKEMLLKADKENLVRDLEADGVFKFSGID
ncbi:MAG: hypothetical protein ACOVP4_00450 [Bacteriovoracaceae bacterium]